ncbi:hypothetical protein SETIT_7G291400v2 [Setaria italica]|uniref:Prolamin-like domain-containing protein n=2 Tax=Setaria TaxID=4554 RepID=A0A368S173_SETIT|nr:egg cell-secreted protein 1.4 [Setaria italica]XP_034604865.1 egg cell-secreted protein 1.4-like [Setaria viridis]RCV36084.1 hypothetical protein SETIT_7G291400v2 [Setaria italica]TKW07391.1 hypothetical protein SEVIR_7G303300v2 [Setaria viridis]
MAQLLRLAAAVALLVFLAATAPAADAGRGAPTSAAPPLAARLRAFSVSLDEAGEDGGGAGGFAECWDALTRLGSCTSEIVLFFVNGESYIGPECCVAIRGATRHCWPSMLAAAGFTAEEADVLRGFCDAEAAHKGSPPPAGPVPAPGKPLV